MPLNEQLEYLQSSLESLPESLPCYDLWDFEEDASFTGRDRSFGSVMTLTLDRLSFTVCFQMNGESQALKVSPLLCARE